MTRFTDYEFEPFDGRLLFRRPVPAVDELLNPVSLRVTYEVERGGEKAWVGWPADPKLEGLRQAWFNTTDAATGKKASDAVQVEAFKFVPYITTAQFILPTAYRSNLSGLIVAPVTFLWNVEKK
jgi:peptide/nickel transport system substrate-binding protein